ncbi:uncharacterized protein [Arachis hypogaea]|uniref:uncharacterized protein n=1 Tax=Arachis hypogaea TaxID=3818 RepID=UPI003B2268C1
MKGKKGDDQWNLEDEGKKAGQRGGWGMAVVAADAAVESGTAAVAAVRRTISIDYIIVDVSSTYNALIGWTTLNQLAAVVSTPHLCMKFSTLKGIATIKGDQKLARRCYNESLNLKGDPRGKETNTIELGGIRAREELRPQPEGETKEIQIGDTQDKTISIGENLKGDLKELLIKLLKDNSDLFAWKAADMPDIDPGLMCHKLAIYPGSLPVHQKCRKLGPKRLQAVEEQVQALLEAGFIREIIEVYVDNMLVKTQSEETLLADLTEVFDTIRKHGMRLNPAKCTFAVETGKFLGFMLIQRRIEANPDKCQAILHKEVQQLNGRLAALSRFLAGSA